MKVQDIVPGMQFEVGPPMKVNGPKVVSTLIQKCDHPMYFGMALVIWRIPGLGLPGDLSLDALSWIQEVGDPIPAREEYPAREQLVDNLHKALFPRR